MLLVSKVSETLQNIDEKKFYLASYKLNNYVYQKNIKYKL